MRKVQPNIEELVTHKYARLRGVTLHYIEAGSGPLVVLLHGFPEFWYAWRNQIPALVEAGYRVVAPDMRGYNLSSKPRSAHHYRIELLTRDVVELIGHLGEDRAHIVGHDWGGYVAWATAMRHPQAVNRLAILNAPHPATFLREVKKPEQLKKSSYQFFFQLPYLPERAIAADDFKMLRALLSAE
ncbi:MAG TPA: alpha/beta hydrolase, partial [Abditibacteriaceae bacterium]